LKSGQCVQTGTGGLLTVTGSACGSGGGYATIQDEGSNLTQRTTVNFIGSGVTCVDNSGSSRTDCTVTSGGSSVVGSSGNVQYNANGAMGGASDFNVWTSSVVIGKDPSAVYTTYISTLQVTSGSMTVLNAGSLSLGQNVTETVNVSTGLVIVDNGFNYTVYPSTGFVVTASTTATGTSLQPLPGLQFQIGANETWQYECSLNVTGASGGVKYGINGPSGATMSAQLFGALGSASAFTSQAMTTLNTASIAFHTAAAATVMNIWAEMTTSSTPGVWQLQREAGTTSTANVLNAGSYCKGQRVL